MLKGVARKHSKQQQHHSPSGCAFLRGKLQVCGADPVLVAKRKHSPKFGAARGPDFGSAQASASASSDAKTSHSLRQTNAAKMRPLRQKPDTEVSHAPRRTRRAKNNTLFLWFSAARSFAPPRPPLQRQRFCSQERTSKLPRAKSGKPNVSQLQETPLQTPTLLPPSRPPS